MNEERANQPKSSGGSSAVHSFQGAKPRLPTPLDLDMSDSDAGSPYKRLSRNSFHEKCLDDHEVFGKAASEVPDCDAFGNFYGLSIRSGPYMLNKQEDRVIAHEKLFGNSLNGLYGVADGHGGYHASQFCSVNLIKSIEQKVKLSEDMKCEESRTEINDQLRQGK